jgi:hypothetical protein
MEIRAGGTPAPRGSYTFRLTVTDGGFSTDEAVARNGCGECYRVT